MTRAAIGIDIGGTRLRAARVRDGVIEARAVTDSSPDPVVVVARLKALVAEVTGPDVSALGIGVPGMVDAATREVFSGGYVNLSGFPFAAEMATATGLSVVIENDASMALLGEAAYGVARGCANVVMMTIGTGIGGAILENGQLLRGRRSAGQLGHMVVTPHGRPCICGRAGCVEATSSGKAFGLHLAEAGLPADTRVKDLLARSDAPARAVIQAWAGPLMAAVQTLISTFHPDMVVIGGGAGAAAAAALQQMVLPPSWFAAPVVAALLGDDAGVIGGAVAALKARGAAKRAVLVNGVPASGKSAVARALADATGWPLLTLDTIKNPFLLALPPGDRLFNRSLGRASYAVIFDLIADAPAGSCFIIDAWFGFQPLDTLQQGLARTGVEEVAELWCHAPPDVVADRYRARLHLRPAGHPGAAYIPELIALAESARPTGLGPRLDIDTTAPLPLARVTGWLHQLWP